MKSLKDDQLCFWKDEMLDVRRTPRVERITSGKADQPRLVILPSVLLFDILAQGVTRHI